MAKLYTSLIPTVIKRFTPILKKFAPEIEKYVKTHQYDQEKYELQLFPGKDKFTIKAQQLIAYSGNTGSSQGAHLHFEIRDNASRPMNPFLFGFDDVVDTRSPQIRSVFAIYSFG